MKTLQGYSDAKVDSVSEMIEDDKDVSYGFMVTYDYHYQYGPLGQNIIVTGFDVSYPGKLSKGERNRIAMELITDSNHQSVYFEI